MITPPLPPWATHASTPGSTKWSYASAFYKDDDATVDDLREAVTTLEDTIRIARRVLGGAHPLTADIERHLRNARSKLASFEALAEGVRDLSVS